jgi:hypothetical protein
LRSRSKFGAAIFHTSCKLQGAHAVAEVQWTLRLRQPVNPQLAVG